jgi:mannitol/fructose-specific phosphotransferase system IIA component (Ntr-type)
MGAKRLAMGLVIPRPPVSFGHPEHDPVRLALAISSADYEAHVDALEEAMRLLTDAPSVEALPLRRMRESCRDVGERLRRKGTG